MELFNDWGKRQGLEQPQSQEVQLLSLAQAVELIRDIHRNEGGSGASSPSSSVTEGKAPWEMSEEELNSEQRDYQLAHCLGAETVACRCIATHSRFTWLPMYADTPADLMVTQIQPSALLSSQCPPGNLTLGLPRVVRLCLHTPAAADLTVTKEQLITRLRHHRMDRAIPDTKNAAATFYASQINLPDLPEIQRTR